MSDKRQDFTSEIYKIEIKNLAKFGFGEIKKFLKIKLNLNPVKIKAVLGKKNESHHAYLCFRNETEKNEALTKLDGYVWKGRPIKACLAKAIVDPMQKKRSENNVPDPKDEKTCVEATAPLAKMPYAEQLELKSDEIIKILKKYKNDAERINPSLRTEFAKLADGEITPLPCKWQGLKASPAINGYRNKSEFAVGQDGQGEKVVGFRMGSYVGGSIGVAVVDDVPHIPEKMKLAAKSFQQFVRASEYNVFCPEFYTGQFRQLCVRLSHSNQQIMLIVGLQTSDIDSEKLELLKKDILEYYQVGEGKELNVTSLYIEIINKRAPGQTTNPFEHILGEKFITESLHGLTLRISPASFFQVNTLAAEVLYQSAIDLASITPNTTVLDICCGTGTIGLCFAKHCKEVLGVELISEAVRDAEHNAQENGISNCKFYSGNCDDYIQSLVHQAQNDDLIAIIDPPRAGLHVKSVSALRNARGLNRFIYIACSPQSALRNWVDLARPSSKTYKGNPFIPTIVTGVDMFPHTNHKEMILLFERVKDEKLPAITAVELAVEPSVDDSTEPMIN